MNDKLLIRFYIDDTSTPGLISVVFLLIRTSSRNTAAVARPAWPSKTFRRDTRGVGFCPPVEPSLT